MNVSRIFAQAILGFCAVIAMMLCTGSVSRASASAKETVLYSFDCSTGGCGPEGPLVRDKAGNLYGTTYAGGDLNCNESQGCGTVYELSLNTQGSWTETTIYSFQGGSDGANPNSGVIFGADGNLYGTTQYGGSSTACGETGCGTIFELSPSASGWTEMILTSFDLASGANPNGIVFDKSGNLYGTTFNGGAGLNCPTTGCGVFYKLSPSSSGWIRTALYSFNQAPDASYPLGSLVFDQYGNLYGASINGGAYYCQYGPCGAIFMLHPSSNGWTERVIWNFTGGEDGYFPNGVVVHRASSTDEGLYGTTYYGGNFHVGTVFELTPSIGNWNLNVVHTFTGGNDGGQPIVGLTSAGSALYGTTQYGGYYEYGTAFQLHPLEGGGWSEQVLYNFTGVSDGGNPNSPVILAPGSLFGTTNSFYSIPASVYELTAP